jgi:uncharacterized membrane protein
LPQRHRSWWLIARDQCVTVYSEFAIRTFWTYAEATDGSKQWPAAGSTSNVMPERFNAGWGTGQGVCFANLWQSCTSSTPCFDKPHEKFRPLSPLVSKTYQ